MGICFKPLIRIEHIVWRNLSHSRKMASLSHIKENIDFVRANIAEAVQRRQGEVFPKQNYKLP